MEALIFDNSWESKWFVEIFVFTYSSFMAKLKSFCVWVLWSILLSNYSFFYRIWVNGWSFSTCLYWLRSRFLCSSNHRFVIFDALLSLSWRSHTLFKFRIGSQLNIIVRQQQINKMSSSVNINIVWLWFVYAASAIHICFLLELGLLIVLHVNTLLQQSK